MGKFRRGWPIVSLILIIVMGVLFAGVSVTHYFQANAAGKPINHVNYKLTNQPETKYITSDTIKQNTNDLKQGKKWMKERQDKVSFAWRNLKEISKVPLKTTAVKASAPSITKDQATPQSDEKESKAAKYDQKKTKAVNNSSTRTVSSSSKKKIVYLTFDDGPADISGDIIRLLERYHFKATFFMIDGNIRRYPEAVKLMVKSGETVGLHSVTHDQKKFYASVNSVLGELNQNRNTLKEISGIDSYFMRTPYGSVPKMTPEYRKAVKEAGYFMWDWNIDSKDWYYKDSRYVYSVIEQLNRMSHHQGPIVILLHERPATLAHLPKLLDYLRKQGYEGKAIDRSTPPYQFKVR